MIEEINSYTPSTSFIGANSLATFIEEYSCKNIIPILDTIDTQMSNIACKETFPTLHVLTQGNTGNDGIVLMVYNYLRKEEAKNSTIKSKEAINKFFERYNTLILDELSQSELLDFMFEYFNNLFSNKDFNSIDLILRLVDINKSYNSILLGFLTIVFHSRKELTYYNDFLNLVVRKLQEEGKSDIAERTCLRFNK